MNYTTTQTGYPELQSHDLRGVAGQVLDTLSDVFTIDSNGQQLGEAIMYEDGGQFYILMIDDGQGVNSYRIETEPGQGPTDDDYDDIIRQWLDENREPACAG